MKKTVSAKLKSIVKLPNYFILSKNLQICLNFGQARAKKLSDNNLSQSFKSPSKHFCKFEEGSRCQRNFVFQNMYNKICKITQGLQYPVFLS